MKNIALLSIATLLILSCSKIDMVDNVSKQDTQNLVNRKSLSEFTKLLPKKQQLVLTETMITKIILDKSSKKIPVIEIAPIHLYWGCPLLKCNFCGICVTNGSPGPIANDEGTVSVIKLLENNQLFIKLNSEEGLTSEGYLPFYENFEINDILDYGNIVIKQGIYQADFNEETNKYESVIVDLI